MRALWLHLRTSPIRWSLPVLVAVDLAVLFLRNRSWIGVWPESGAAAQVPAYLLGVVAAGAAAWAAGTPTRHRLDEQLAVARAPAAASEAYRLGATLILLLIPYVIGQVVAFAVTARTFPPGLRLFWGYALLGLFVMVMATALGWLCGRLLGTLFAALAAAMGFLFLVAILGRVDFVVVSGRPEMTVDPVGLALRLGSVVVVLLALLWLPSPGRARPARRRALWLVPAVLPLAAVVAATSPVVERTPPGNDVMCVNGRMTLCIWPEHEKYLPKLRSLNARIALLPDRFVPPPRMNEIGIEQTRHLRPDGVVQIDEDAGAPTFYILEGSPWSYAGDVGTAITNVTLGFTDARHCNWDSLTSADQERLWVLGAWLEAYLVGRNTPDYQTDAPTEMQAAWARGRGIAGEQSPAEQFRWAEGEASDLRGRYCRSAR
ncbi:MULTISPECIES: hypothetical protein [Micromonospora]|uniref:ABC transporter permease n=1 Tax=Micromonospora solifontis TaxID=2487138 RepID=A0ABX9WAX2_9ACTN|nr:MULTISPECIES: hypothetical protein [Micromonospora]NES17281.1 hypothetical protein [Micromonospora sp. PPF5-17B]NES39639.1 hypothetical protein [Micromonospora solifontis]NES59105.1 hypothetical protein [Micromonospora sp. PPF5-6]RNL87810.1 hypothetical protein EFE23_26535 [Micromonospora solifontis]